ERQSTPLALDEEAVWVILLWEYFLQTGDRQLLTRLYPELRARLSRLHDHCTEFGILDAEGGPGARAAVFVDDVDLDRRGEMTAANAFYHRALLTAARVAAGVADLPAQREYEHRALALRQAVNWRLWSESHHAYADCRTRHGRGQRVSAETNWLAIAFGLADSRRAVALRQWLDGGTATAREPSPFFQSYVLEALYTLGDTTAAQE